MAHTTHPPLLAGIEQPDWREKLHAPNLVELLHLRADSSRALTYLNEQGKPEPLTWGKVSRSSFAFGQQLEKRGVKPGDRVVLMLPTCPGYLYAFFGVIVMTSTALLAGTYYHYLDVSWIDSLHNDQYVAGGIAWSAGEVPLVIVVLALVTQWARQDAKVAARTDRHLDAGLDDSYEAYNQMLAKLAERRQAAVAGATPAATAATTTATSVPAPDEEPR